MGGVGSGKPAGYGRMKKKYTKSQQQSIAKIAKATGRSEEDVYQQWKGVMKKKGLFRK